MAVPFTEPRPIVPVLELEEGLTQVLHGGERPHPQQLLLERPDEPLGHPVALWLPHERGTGRDAQELQLRSATVIHGRAAAKAWRMR